MDTFKLKNQEIFKKLYDEWSISGKSMTKFCSSKGISKDKFFYWKNKHGVSNKKENKNQFKKNEIHSSFIPVAFKNISDSSEMIKITTKEGLLIEMNTSNLEHFLRVIRTLELEDRNHDKTN